MSIDLDAIRARCDAATEGPWEAMIFDSGHSEFELQCSVITSDIGDRVCEFDGLARINNEKHKNECAADSLFIAHARQDIPDLLAEVERLRAEVARLTEQFYGTCETCGKYVWPLQVHSHPNCQASE